MKDEIIFSRNRKNREKNQHIPRKEDNLEETEKVKDWNFGGFWEWEEEEVERSGWVLEEGWNEKWKAPFKRNLVTKKERGRCALSFVYLSRSSSSSSFLYNFIAFSIALFCFSLVDRNGLGQKSKLGNFKKVRTSLFCWLLLLNFFSIVLSF